MDRIAEKAYKLRHALQSCKRAYAGMVRAMTALDDVDEELAAGHCFEAERELRLALHNLGPTVLSEYRKRGLKRKAF